MNPVSLKFQLGKLIKSSLRTTSLKQLDLAQHLQISTSAVSQMLNGKTAPTAVHLNKIFKLLNCTRNQVFIMSDLLAQIRSGMHELRSPMNEFIKSDNKHSVQIPVISLENIFKFNSVLDDIKNFIWRNHESVISAQTLNDSINSEDVFAVVGSGDNFNPPLPGSVRLVVAVENFLQTNDIVIAKSKTSDKLQLKRFIVEDDRVFLRPFIGSAGQHELKTHNFDWMRKVLAIVISTL